MKLRTIVPPVLVVLAVAWVASLAARSPLSDRPAALNRPVASDLSAAVQQVDAELAALWQADGIEPAAVVEDDLAIFRRLSLALHGTIPSLEEIRRFEADQRPDRLERWTTAMLEDARFADYFAQRLSRAFVGVEEGQFVLFRRDRFNEWLSQQLQDHRPYDEIVREMISGTGVWTGDPEVNFLTGAYANEQFDQDKLTGRVVRAFLGQRIDCAQCHDHPFTHWKQGDFEGLTAHFSELNVSLVGIEDKAGQRGVLSPEAAATVQQGPVSAEVRGDLGRHKIDLPENAVVAALDENQLWVVTAGPAEGAADEELEAEDAARTDVRAVLRRTDEGIAIFLPEREHVIDDARAGELRIASPTVPFGQEWVPDSGTRRERLAAWVTHPQNKRFERAIANRVWALMFGKPYYTYTAVDDLPDPEEDIASLKVLDALGADFRAHGCDIRRLVQVIAASQAFRLDSVHPVQVALDDAAEGLSEDEYRDACQTVERIESRWAVFPLVRLRPEQVIGAMLQANHVTTIDRNSHLFVRFQRLTRENDFVNEFGDPGEAELEDRVGTIPQALLRMNGQFARELTEAGPFSAPGRISGMSSTPEQCLETAYLVCLTRRPTAEEAAHFLPQLQERKGPAAEGVMQDLFWTLFNSPEFNWNH